MNLHCLDAPAGAFSLSPRGIPGLPPLKSVPGKKRVVKDVLVVGTFKGFKATPDVLSAIANRFGEHKDAGIRHPLCWGHGKLELGGDTDERDSIDDIDDVWTDGKKLWMSAYVSDDDAAQLRKKRREVSVGIAHDWTDPATDKKWGGPNLMHVAVVAHAAVPGQEPFVELSAETKPGTPMTFDVVMESLNKLAKAAGHPELPETVTEQNFNDVVPAIVDAWTGQTKKDDPMAEAAEKTENAGKKPETVAMNTETPKIETLSATIATQADQITALTATIDAMKAKEAAKLKSDFEAQVETCLKAGMPAASKDTFIQLGAELHYSATAFNALSAFAATNKLKLGSQLGSVVSSEEPKTGITAEQKAEALSALLGTAG